MVNKRFMMSGMALLLAMAVVIAGCSSNNKEAASPTASASGSPAASASASPSADPGAAANAEKFAVSYLDGMWDPVLPPAEGEAVKMINEKFNIDLQTQFLSYGDYADKLAVTVASGELPDMIGMENANDANFVKWAEQGAFLPLNDYIGNIDGFKDIPKEVWDAVTVNGKIYAIPRYFPAKYGKKPIIRQDWLDNLGLSMPTNYEELKQVAIAFTKNDPDKNGKNDTYGLGLSMNDAGLQFGAWMGAYWDSGAWYHQNDKGQYIPGIISQGNKEHVQVLSELYKAGAISKDWAVAKTNDVRKDFFAGKYGIYYEQPYDFNQSRFATLKELNPSANVSIIPSFQQPDGNQGFLAGSGYYQVLALNGKLADQPDKINRILGMIGYFTKFIPFEQRTSANADFDWQNGFEGKGYSVIDGVAVNDSEKPDLIPKKYIVGRYWAPNDEANEVAKTFTDPLAKAFVENAVGVLKETKFYFNPINRIYSPKQNEKQWDLDIAFNDRVTRMIVGNESIDKWDSAVKEYLSKGGQELIDEVNQLFKDKGITGEWK